MLKPVKMGRMPPRNDVSSIPLTSYSLGINTVRSDRHLEKRELTSAVNFKYNEFGGLETRPGLTLVTASALPSAVSVKTIARVPIGATSYTMLVGSDHKIYYLNGSSVPTAIDTSYTAEGAVQIVPYAGYAVILDGGYMKYWDGTNFKMAYDDGIGDSGYMVNYTCASNDTSRALYSGSTTESAAPAAMPSWTAGYTIPATSVDVWLSATGSPTGNVTCKIYNSGKELLATSDAVDASTLTTYATQRSFTFSTSTNLAPSPTSYFVSVVYSGGDVSNCVNVHRSTTASYGNVEDYYDGSWHDGTGVVLYGLKPGRPPKGAFGDIKDNRLFVAGDPDNRGYVWYSNTNTIFDWCTVDGGGYIGAVDDNANSFPVGGIVAHFTDLLIIGKSSRPYICRLTGSSPTEYALPPLFQQCYTDHKTLVSSVNDIWFSSKDGVHALSGVQEYGDLRAFSQADAISTLFKTYYDTNAFAAYNPSDGQYIIKLNTYANTLVCHTKHPVKDSTGKVRYPWTQYLFKNLVPSAFATWGGTFYVGCTNGNLYSLTAAVNDVATQPDYELQSGWMEFPLARLLLKRLYVLADSTATAAFNILLYTNGSGTVKKTIAQTVADSPMYNWMHLPARSFRWKINALTITAALKFQGLGLSATPMEKLP